MNEANNQSESVIQILDDAVLSLSSVNDSTLVATELEELRSKGSSFATSTDVASYLGQLACRLYGAGEAVLALDLLSLACKVKEWESDRSIIELAALLARYYYNHNDIGRSIQAYECLKICTPRIKTSTLILASLYFRRGLVASASEGDHAAALDDLAKAYTYRRDLLELCRVYATGSESDLSAGRPAKFESILQVAELVNVAIYPSFLSKRSSFNPKLYSMLRASLRLLGRFQEFEYIQKLWIDHASDEAQSLYLAKKYKTCQAICYLAIDLHPTHSSNTHALSVFFQLLGLCARHLMQPREAELFGRLSIASYYFPSCESSSVVSIARRIAVENRIVLAYVSEMYVQMFEIWLKFYKRHCQSGLLVVALDKNASEWLSSRGVPHTLRPFFSHQKDFFWGTDFLHDRMEILASLVTFGFDTLLTGVDSIWLKNPFSFLQRNDADVIAMGLKSSVQNWPLNINNDFLYIKGGGAFSKHCPRLLEISKRLVSDQQAINLILSDLGISWTQDDTGAWQGIVQSDNLKAFLLPESFSSRDIATLSADTSIFQPPGGFDSKMAVIRGLESSHLDIE